MDGLTGLHYFGARYLDSRLSVWFGVDPMAEKYPGYNPYNYVLNNPVRLIDPTGLSPENGGGDPVKIIVQKSVPQRGDVGHVFVSVEEGDETVVYTYGRYAELSKDKGSLNGSNLSGEGVLIKLEGQDAINEVNKYIDKYQADVFTIENADGGKVKEYFESLLTSSADCPSIGKYKDDERARVIDEYNLLENNCTTLSVCGVSSGMAGNRISYIDKVKHPKFIGNVRMFVTSISPDGLFNQLNEASSLKQNNIIKR